MSSSPQRTGDSVTGGKTRRILLLARDLGFQLVGVTSLMEPGPEKRAFENWIAAGFAGEMDYLAERERERTDARNILPGAASILCLGMHYGPPQRRKGRDKSVSRTREGRVASYAQGRDYHLLIKRRLKKLRRFIERELPGVRTYMNVDAGPVLERAHAARAGLGFLGRNTMLIHPEGGSYFFLAQIILDRPLEAIPARAAPFPDCGTCTACLDACPTDAFPEPGVLDATKCISYLTIEHSGSIPEGLRRQMGDRVFGCDICQEVCPWNRHAPVTAEKDFRPRKGHARLDLAKLLVLSKEEMKEEFLGTPLYRAAGSKMKRNALVALGNSGSPRARTIVETFLHGEKSPLLREHAEWALERLGRGASSKKRPAEKPRRAG